MLKLAGDDAGSRPRAATAARHGSLAGRPRPLFRHSGIPACCMRAWSHARVRDHALPHPSRV